MQFWSNLRTKHRAKQNVRKRVTDALSTKAYPISHWDDFSRVASDTHTLLNKAAIQFPLAKDRILQRYIAIIRRGNACTTFHEEEQFELRYLMMQNITIEIQSLRAEVAALEREAVRARNEGEGPDDGAGWEFGEVSWVECMRRLRVRAGLVLEMLEGL